VPPCEQFLTALLLTRSAVLGTAVVQEATHNAVYLFIARQLPLHSTFLHVDAALLGRIITSLTEPTAPVADAAIAASARTNALEREHALLGLIGMLRPEPAEARRLLALSERAGFFQVRQVI